MPDDLMLSLARLMRCPMVSSGTRNDFAISPVVSPPTARSVSAIADAGVSAGWQHMNSRTRVSSGSISAWPSVAGATARSASPATAASRFRRDASLRSVIDHPSLRDADQPAERIVGDAIARPLGRRRNQRFLDSVFGRGEVAKSPDHRAKHLRRELAQQVFDVAGPATTRVIQGPCGCQ